MTQTVTCSTMGFGQQRTQFCFLSFRMTTEPELYTQFPSRPSVNQASRPPVQMSNWSFSATSSSGQQTLNPQLTFPGPASSAAVWPSCPAGRGRRKRSRCWAAAGRCLAPPGAALGAWASAGHSWSHRTSQTAQRTCSYSGHTSCQLLFSYSQQFLVFHFEHFPLHEEHSFGT